MKKRVILILCVLAVLLTAVICLPFARKEDRYHRHCHGIPVQ